MKLVANLALGVSIAAVGEALSIGEALGLSQAALLDMLEDSQFGPAVRAKRSNIETGEFQPSFKLRHAEKDLRLVVEAAAAAKLNLRVASAAKEWFDEAAEAGAADLDFSAVVAKITGRER
jgi:3-hydroxyisobutyrate dehydrogenase-like beta-hydroxyacid dehydrogenase